MWGHCSALMLCTSVRSPAAASSNYCAGAEALVNPIRWPEPFGLAMIEALACGTPVLAFRDGSAPEIVDDGRTGFLCADEDDLAAKLAVVGDLDRSACRAAVEARFTTARMVNDHLALYRRLLEPTAVRTAPVQLSDGPARGSLGLNVA